MASKETPRELVVRFSTAHPDIVLTVASPSTTTCLALKQRIRAQLPEPASASRLRLIHSGKVLTDAAALSKSVNVTAPPPTAFDEGKGGKAKGKLPVREPLSRVYIHCSIGDVLTTSELTAEAKAAEDADTALPSKVQPTLSTGTAILGQEASTTTPAPRGFDRLLTAGFSASEVAALRTQFFAIQSHTHTPDTMPTGAALLALEEQWLDNGSDSTGGGSGGDGSSEDADSQGLEDMLYGNLIGFFWPIGAMVWLMREEGIWSRRRQIAVLSGFLVNVTFGFLRLMN